MVNNRLILFGVICLFMGMSGMVNAAFHIKAEVGVNGVRWDNVTKTNGKLAPSAWRAPSAPALRATTEWVPGSLAIKSPTSIILQGGLSNISSATIPIIINGVQYYTATGTVASHNYNGTCSTSAQTAVPISTVLGDTGCMSSKKLITSVPKPPFIFYRPLFTFNDNDITAAMSGKEAGTYTGLIALTSRYYYNSGNILTYRDINDVLTITIKYEPNHIRSVDLCADTVIFPPHYDTDAQTISSQKECPVTVRGYFNNGLELTMPTQIYQLEHTTDSSSATIPYKVSCVTGCDDVELVDASGVLQKNNTVIQGAQKSELGFRLKFEYKVSGDGIRSGEYSDSIVLTLKPRI